MAIEATIDMSDTKPTKRYYRASKNHKSEAKMIMRRMIFFIKKKTNTTFKVQHMKSETKTVMMQWAVVAIIRLDTAILSVF